MKTVVVATSMAAVAVVATTSIVVVVAAAAAMAAATPMKKRHQTQAVVRDRAKPTRAKPPAEAKVQVREAAVGAEISRFRSMKGSESKTFDGTMRF